MEKLLNERLRDDASMGEQTFSAEELEAFADEIERCYIPRPRFEDGEAVQWCDLFRGYNGEECSLAAFTVSSEGRYVLNEYPGDYDYSLESYNDFVKRPTPKVYDADGVEIKVGERVWNNHLEYVVKSIEQGEPYGKVYYTDGGYDFTCNIYHQRPVFDANGERICKGDTVWFVRSKDTRARTVDDIEPYDGTMCAVINSMHYEPGNLTHREPDSLERLRDNVVDMLLEWNACPVPAFKIRDRFNALIERGAK